MRAPAVTLGERFASTPNALSFLLTAGLALGRYPRLALRTDLSYGVYVYGFVVQQALLACGVRLGWAPFAMLSLTVVLPIAAASWFLVEHPATRRRRSTPRRPATRPDLLDGRPDGADDASRMPAPA